MMLHLRVAQALATVTTTSSRRFASLSFRAMSSTAAPLDDDSMITFNTQGHVGNAVEHAMASLYKANAVCFDVDSTVIAEEGIDVLAAFLGKGEAVAALTRQAMEGGMAFQDALKARLDLLQPSKPSIFQCLKEQPFELTHGVKDLMQALQQKNVDIWLVSGGFRIMIEPVAQQLDIPITNIVANTLLFHDDGSYRGFDPNEPTSADMGKPKALTSIQSKMGYETMIMVGDGATDAQAKPPAAAFIGFGGVVERAAVKAKADWFVTDFTEMTRIVMALKRAREKLHGAMQKRERALKRMRPGEVAITPITALSANLVIQNVPETGPPESVYFPFAAHIGDLGQAQVQGTTSKPHNLPVHKDTSQSLFERKLRLQHELQLLKEKLEICQQDDDSAFGSNDDHKQTTANQSQMSDDQDRDKGDGGQTIIDLSHWKNFVSKQAKLLDDTTKRLTETKQALMDCESEQQETESQLQTIHQELIDLEKREKAVIKLLKGATFKLFRTRVELHQANVSTVTELDI